MKPHLFSSIPTWMIILTGVMILFSACQEPEKPEPYPNSDLVLEKLDVSCTEAWLKLYLTQTAPGATEYHGAVEWYPVAASFNDDQNPGDYEEVDLLGDGLISEQDAEYEVVIDFYQQTLVTDPPNKEQMIAALSGMDRCYGHLKELDQWQVILEQIAANFDKEEQQQLAKNYLIWVYKKLGLDAEAIAAAQGLINDCSDPEYIDYYTLEIALLLDDTDGSIGRPSTEPSFEWPAGSGQGYGFEFGRSS